MVHTPTQRVGCGRRAAQPAFVSCISGFGLIRPAIVPGDFGIV
jgi:hypothetical protein